MAAEIVRELAARVSVQTDTASFAKADRAVAAVKVRLQGAAGAAQGANQAIAAAGSAVSGVASNMANSLAGVAGSLGLGVGIAGAAMLAKSAFIDFNSSIEQATISLAATQKLFKGGTWGESMQTATALFTHYQDVAKRSVGTTQDFLEMHRGIAASAYQAGATLEDLKEITAGAVVAGQMLGESAFVTSMDIKQALSKGVEVRDRFMITMLASQKITKEQFNAMSKMQRVATLKKLLTDPTIKDAAKQMETSFAGVTSTLKDNLEIAFGKVGMPLFKQITREIERWNKWLDANPKKIEQLMRVMQLSLGQLASAYEAVKVAFGGAGMTLGAVFGWVEQLNAGLAKVTGWAQENPLSEAFRSMTAPVTTVIEKIQDFYRWLTGQGSAIGLSMMETPEQQNAYMAHWRKGGKFDLGGEAVALGQEGGIKNAVNKAKAGALQAGKGAIGGLASVALPLPGAGIWGPAAYDWLTGANAPTAPVNPQALQSREPVNVAGSVKVQVEVSTPDGMAVQSQSHEAELRGANELMSPAP